MCGTIPSLVVDLHPQPGSNSELARFISHKTVAGCQSTGDKQRVLNSPTRFLRGSNIYAKVI